MSIELGKRRLGVRGLALALQVGVILTLAVMLFSADAPAGRAALIAVAALPLLLTLPGLIGARTATLRWLAVALVAYVGLATVEVVATAAPSAAAMLLFSLLELALVLVLIRRPGPR